MQKEKSQWHAWCSGQHKPPTQPSHPPNQATLKVEAVPEQAPEQALGPTVVEVVETGSNTQLPKIQLHDTLHNINNQQPLGRRVPFLHTVVSIGI